MKKIDHSEKEIALRWINGWKNAEKMIEQERKKRIAESDSSEFIQMTAGLVHSYLVSKGFRDSSGLVEQQHFFRKMNHA